MVRTAKWTVIRGNDTREFVAHYVDDTPARAEAIAFFQGLNFGLYSNCPITDELWALPVAAANAHLAAHPIQQTFNSLYSRGSCDEVCDEDLSRLIHIPELIRFHICSDSVTDAGIRYIGALRNLEGLIIHSARVTDRCLTTIARLKSLQCLDMQGSPLVSTPAFQSLLKELPSIKDSWGPHH